MPQIVRANFLNPIILIKQYIISTVFRWLCRLLFPKRNTYYRKKLLKKPHDKSASKNGIYRAHKKPQWVIDEVTKIKAHLPDISCRRISEIFNERFEGISISKSYVAYTVKAHHYHIQRLRKNSKAKPAYQIPFNKTWGMDLTFVDQRPVLGITEHHSRQCLQLIPLPQKTTANILLVLLSLLKQTPKPTIIRTDNEACFTAKRMKAALWILGIRHQTIQKHSPWQNGRIERLFGTFKEAIKPIKTSQENHWFLCQDFAYWYNHIRPHQSINYQTPNTVFEQQLKRWQPPDR